MSATDIKSETGFLMDETEELVEKIFFFNEIAPFKRKGAIVFESYL